MAKLQTLTSFRKISPFPQSTLKGMTGLQGIQGESGYQGNQGLKGETGDRGEAGPKGDQGDTGLQGPKGSIGPVPAHNWDGTKLSFQLPNGLWGDFVELQGADGKEGKLPDIIPKAFSTSIGAVRGLQAQLDALNEANMQYDTLIDTVSTVKYIGQALPGSTQSSALWRIKKVDLSATDGDVEIVWADGTAEFTKVWDDRLSYNYTVEA